MGVEIRTKVLALFGAGSLGIAFAAYALLGRVHETDAESAALHALRLIVRSQAAERGPLADAPSAQALVAAREEVRRSLSLMKQRTGAEFAVVLQKKALDQAAWARANGAVRDTWNDRPTEVVLETTTYGEGLVDFRGELDALPEDGTFIEEFGQEGRTLVRGAFPLRDAARRRVGALFVLHDFTDVRQVFQASRHRGLFVVIGLAVVVLAIVAVSLERLVFRRLAGLRAVLEQSAPAQAPPPQFYAADEIAKLEILVAAAGLASGRPARAPTSGP